MDSRTGRQNTRQIKLLVLMFVQTPFKYIHIPTPTGPLVITMIKDHRYVHSEPIKTMWPLYISWFYKMLMTYSIHDQNK